MQLSRLLTFRNFPAPCLEDVNERLLQREVPDAARYIYLAQPITGNKARRRWVPPFKRWAAARNVHCFDPVTDFKRVTHIPSVLVKFDYALIRHSHLLICDFTRGPSVGATAEMVYASNIGLHVIGVVNKGQGVSDFAYHYCNYVLTPDQVPAYAGRALALNA